MSVSDLYQSDLTQSVTVVYSINLSLYNYCQYTWTYLFELLSFYQSLENVAYTLGQNLDYHLKINVYGSGYKKWLMQKTLGTILIIFLHYYTYLYLPSQLLHVLQKKNQQSASFHQISKWGHYVISIYCPSFYFIF